ncbi:ATP-binding protein [Streptomyces caatingaensis]|uniref:ATP-binding protein n=1 Tax=Streptomyces caatingaensis TaxID=1678637 RepID=UPI000A885CCC|nr:ATP-binding protein [Streptomyces caatingaensis]
MSHHISEAGLWCLAVALVAAVVLLVRQRRIAAALRARAAALEENVRARDDEAARLVDVRLPAVTDAADTAVPLPGLLDDRLAGTAFAHSLQAVMDLFAQAVDKAQVRADQSAKAALRASMRALQGLAHEQQLAISTMQERHDDPEVLRDLLEIDHTNAQFGRRAQAIGVLCGSWPGRQRVASPLTDVVRGATSRIRDYRRVRVHGPAGEALAVVSRAVEPVVLAVAELLDNAARHSQPNTTVEVSLQPVHNGACVVIDDAGVGMDRQEVERAVALLSGRRGVDVSRLGDPPQFGFPVVGALAARYGFSVSVDTRSPYGGVRAVLFLPAALLTHLDLDGPGTVPLTAPGRPSPQRRRATGTGGSPADPYDSPAGSGARGTASAPSGTVPGARPEPGPSGDLPAGWPAQAPAHEPAGRPAGAAGTAPGTDSADGGAPADHPAPDPSGPGPGPSGHPAPVPSAGARPAHAPEAGGADPGPADPSAPAQEPPDGFGPRQGAAPGGPAAPGHEAYGRSPGAPETAPGPARHAAPGRPGTAGPAGHTAPAPAEQPPAEPFGRTAGGLPKRRRRRPGTAGHPAARPAPAAPPAEAPAERSPEETARRMGAFARGTRSGRTPAAGTPLPGPLPAPAEDEGNPSA